MRIKQGLIGLTVALVLAEILLVLLSWLLSAMMVDGVQSLLSSEGLRWFFGSFTTMLMTPWLVWIILLAMAGGCFWRSGLLQGPKTFRDRTALHTFVAILIFSLIIVAALTVVPHAVLLSATGRLFPSPFSRAFVPIVAFWLFLSSAVYGRMSGRFTSATDVFDSLSYGIGCAAPLLILYFALAQFCASLQFVFL